MSAETAPESAYAARRRSRVAPLVVGLGLAAVAAIGAWVILGRSGGSTATAAAPARSVALQPITTRDLVETASYDGTLAYDDQKTLGAAVPGTITRLPAVGVTATRGKILYAIDNVPTVLMYGSFPMYRTLQSGVTDGRDVEELEKNLTALGYGSGLTVDSTWSSATTIAVEAWQTDLGLTVDGVIPKERIVFAPARLRIAAHSLEVGDNASQGAALLTTSTIQRDVTVSLAVTDASIVKAGDTVAVTLPSGDGVSGKVTDVGTVATAAATGTAATGGGSTGASSATGDSTIDVSIRVTDTKALGDLATAPVTVAFTRQRATGVLSVPTTALLSLADGGFAVEVSDGGAATHLVRVTPGLFSAGGFVEVKGDVKAGQQVVVPK
jgi:peptidoglycan hydrolase-like protein with peptidoglycan-binding domain